MFDEYYSYIDNATNDIKIEMVSPNEFKIWMQKYGNLLEFLILALSVFDISAICIMFYVFSKSPQFHFHLIALIRLLFISFMGYAGFRNILIILSFFLSNSPMVAKTLIPINLMFLEHLKLAFGTAYIAGTLPFMLERIFATIWLSNYEKKTWPLFIIFSYIFQLSSGFGLALLVYQKPQMVILLTTIGIFGAIIQTIIFLFVDRVNQRRYKESTTVGNSYTLSERFQLSENIRSSKLMKWSQICAAIGNTIVLILFLLYWAFTDPGYKLICKLILELVITIYALVFVYVALQACEIWKRTFFNVLGACRARVIPISYSISTSSGGPNYHNFVRTSKGEQMIFSAAQESELYFQQLRSTWA